MAPNRNSIRTSLRNSIAIDLSSVGHGDNALLDGGKVGGDEEPALIVSTGRPNRNSVHTIDLAAMSEMVHGV
ncbi:hypothetical protein SERLADRAFT_385360, partial [Serpula lacrymans var. lacrymans S7.9]